MQFLSAEPDLPNLPIHLVFRYPKLTCSYKKLGENWGLPYHEWELLSTDRESRNCPFF